MVRKSYRPSIWWSVGHPTDALRLALYTPPGSAKQQSSCFAYTTGEFSPPGGFQFHSLVARKELQIVQSGERTNAAGKPVGNKILLSISDSEYNSLRPHLEYLRLPNHLVLHESNGKLDFAYFPNRGLISLVVVMKDGKTAEAGVVGNEGFTGTPSVVGLSRGPLRAVVQVTGDGFRVKVGALQNTLESTPRLQLMLNRHVAIRGMQIAQTAACNRLHDIKQRLARWLLMTQDRVDSGALPITHDFLATMLGTDRPSVTLAAGVLQKKGLIEYTRGAVRVVNRKQLEDSACECYGVIRQYDGELGLK
jgi:CRP-like cAMP-binding protein